MCSMSVHWTHNLLFYTTDNLTFRGPCIVIYSYNKNQRDGLFLKFILVKNYANCLLADSQHNKYDKYLLLCVQCWDSWWWTVNLSETCRVLYQNKFEKQCISLVFIIRIHIIYLLVTMLNLSDSTKIFPALFQTTQTFITR